MELPPRHHSALFVGEGPLFGPTFNELPDSFEGTLGISVRQGPAVGVLGLIQKRGSSALSALPVLKQSRPVYGNAVEALQVEVLAEYPHDVQAFTQGLLWHDGHLFESTGLTGRSSLRMVVLETGEVVRRVDLPGSLFGEGLALVEDRLIQLTWLAGKALYYDLETFEEFGTSSYLGQGWGLTYGDTFLIMSDGSNQLTFRDPASFAIWQRVPVTLNGSPVRRLNELEWVDGQVYANIWQESEIVRINPQSGEVTAVIDTSALPYQPQNPADDSLNGIAYLPERETFLLTGKKWPKIFEVRFIPTAD
ncbi:MAG: glutaminyl-peptide cyclotransferase [Acidobacteriota bacterium]|nr:MAG: glutaminyl-peptide cyclotransferase [Acidobacteriota bacterium]